MDHASPHHHPEESYREPEQAPFVALPERAGRLAPRRLTWTSLYVLTFAVLMICGFIRGVAAYIVIWIAFKLLGQPTDLVNTLALIVAYGPMLYSLAILFWPKLYGGYWQRAVGGRRASDREQRLIDGALEVLLDHQPGLPPPAHIFIRDDPTINAAVCADRIELNTGALFDADLPATLAHELGHLNSEDGRLTAATYALALFPHLARDSRLTAKGLFVSVITGEAGLWLFKRPWAAYYRQREYHADEYAARLGQGPQLAWSLENSALLHDRPVPFAWMSQNSHPPTELRIERLQRFADQPH